MWVQLFILICALWGLNLYPEIGNEIQRKYARKKYIIFMMVLFCLQSGLRHIAVGPDTFAYYQMFNEIRAMSWNSLIDMFIRFIENDEGKDPGYKILQYLFAVVIPSYRFFLIAIAVFFFTAMGNFLYKYTNSNKEVLVAIALYQCLYYSFMSITGLRQTIATGFLLFAIPYIIEKKWTTAFILFLLAVSQHKSALLFAGFVILPMIKKPRWLLLFTFIAFIPMFKFGGKIASFLMSGTRFEQYSMYLEGFEGAGAYSFTAFILLLGICLFIKSKQMTNANSYGYIFINAIAISILLTPLTMIDPSNMRIVQYYSIFALITLPQFITILSKKYPLNIHIIIFIILGIYTVFGLQYEYGFFWQDMSLGSNYGLNIKFNEFDLNK